MAIVAIANRAGHSDDGQLCRQRPPRRGRPPQSGEPADGHVGAVCAKAVQTWASATGGPTGIRGRVGELGPPPYVCVDSAGTDDQTVRTGPLGEGRKGHAAAAPLARARSGRTGVAGLLGLLSVRDASTETWRPGCGLRRPDHVGPEPGINVDEPTTVSPASAGRRKACSVWMLGWNYRALGAGRDGLWAMSSASPDGGTVSDQLRIDSPTRAAGNVAAQVIAASALLCEASISTHGNWDTRACQRCRALLSSSVSQLMASSAAGTGPNSCSCRRGSAT